MDRKVSIKKVYSKESHIKKSEHGYAPIYSVGYYNKKSFNVTIHMTPELRNHPTERKALLRHEQREAAILAKRKATKMSTVKDSDSAHRTARSKDPKWLKRSCDEVWARLGKDSSNLGKRKDYREAGKR